MGENPEKINPFQPNPTRFVSKPIPFQPIYPLNPLTPIQTIPQNNPTQKLQILSDPLAGLIDWDKTYIETVHQHSAKTSTKPSTKETSYLHLLFTYILCAHVNLQQAAIQVRRQHSAPNQPPPPPSFTTRTKTRHFTQGTGATPMPPVISRSALASSGRGRRGGRQKGSSPAAAHSVLRMGPVT